MTAKRNMLMVVTALVIGGTMLMGAGTAQAGGRDRGHRGDDHGRYSQRYDGRDHAGYGGRDYRHDDRDHSGVRFGVTWGAPAVPTYTTTTTQVWVPGGYVTQMQNVLVEPAHWEMVTVPAVTETRYPSNGAPYTVVITPAHQERMWIADRYEQRAVQVPVAGHWETVSQQVPVIVEQPAQTTISVGGIFRF